MITMNLGADKVEHGFAAEMSLKCHGIGRLKELISRHKVAPFAPFVIRKKKVE
jgi:hypothetical protein